MDDDAGWHAFSRNHQTDVAVTDWHTIQTEITQKKIRDIHPLQKRHHKEKHEVKNRAQRAHILRWDLISHRADLLLISAVDLCSRTWLWRLWKVGREGLLFHLRSDKYQASASKTRSETKGPTGNGRRWQRCRNVWLISTCRRKIA